jgi:phosphoserine phosphatase
LVERGRLVGMGSGPVCYGDGKRYWAEEWARAHHIRMEDAVAYADNWSDRSLLERAGRAVVVHPRGRLLRLARARGWDIVRPRRPAAAQPITDKALHRERDHDSSRPGA